MPHLSDFAEGNTLPSQQLYMAVYEMTGWFQAESKLICTNGEFSYVWFERRRQALFRRHPQQDYSVPARRYHLICQLRKQNAHVRSQGMYKPWGRGV